MGQYALYHEVSLLSSRIPAVRTALHRSDLFRSISGNAGRTDRARPEIAEPWLAEETPLASLAS